MRVHSRDSNRPAYFLAPSRIDCPRLAHMSCFHRSLADLPSLATNVCYELSAAEVRLHMDEISSDGTVLKLFLSSQALLPTTRGTSSYHVPADRLPRSPRSLAVCRSAARPRPATLSRVWHWTMARSMHERPQERWGWRLQAYFTNVKCGPCRSCGGTGSYGISGWTTPVMSACSAKSQWTPRRPGGRARCIAQTATCHGVKKTN